MDRVFIKNNKVFTEEQLTEIWLDDQYTLLKFEQWWVKKGYKITTKEG